MDFTIKTYKNLLNAFISKGYKFLTVSEYIASDIQMEEPIIMLRHDVEARYENALLLAQIQSDAGLKGTYYFRIFPKKKNEEIIRQIVAMGHEIGYHYDDLSHCKGDKEKAIERFQQHLGWLRQFGSVTTISMEGAPLSKYDNRDLWTKPLLTNSPLTTHHSLITTPNSLLPQSLSLSVSPSLNLSVPQSLSLSPLTTHISPPPSHYSHFCIKTEPYFDLDFDKIFYITDTARRWDGWNYSRRDKMKQQTLWISKGWYYHHTSDIIAALHEDLFPTQLMMTFHPQRWAINLRQWISEMIKQNLKNPIKRILI